MEMTRLEKFFVNREAKGQRNWRRVQGTLAKIDADGIREVLEIGCGIGTVSARLADETGWNVTGTDHDPRQIEEAKSRYPEAGGLRFRREDATELTIADGSFDLAIAQMVFHHIPDWPKAVKELARVVRPGGAVIWRDLVISATIAGLLGPLAPRFGICVREHVQQTFLTHGFRILSVRPERSAAISFAEMVLVRQ